MLPRRFSVAAVILLVLSMLLTACAPVAAPAPAAAPAVVPTEAPAAPTAAPAAPAAVKNSLGVTLPADAAPLDKQVFHDAGMEGKHFDFNKNVYE